MNIVIEGPDGAGKSTLCNFLSFALGRVIVGGEGPTKGMGELDQRIRRMMHYQNVIFDRHPAVSGNIYQPLKGPDVDRPSEAMTIAFYSVPHLFVYCHPNNLSSHAAANAEVDTPEYLAWLESEGAAINAAYEAWALARANFIYRPGDNMNNLANALRGAM